MGDSIKLPSVGATFSFCIMFAFGMALWEFFGRDLITKVFKR